MINRHVRVDPIRPYAAAMSARHRASAPISSAFARGWYLISWSADLAPGQVVPLRYFARDFVLYRGQEGTPVLLDAHCPHLGAHLGHGGCVEGAEIVCPFHAWRFDASGRCSGVPYAKRIPAKASVGAHRVVEHSGMVLAFISPDGSDPDYEVPRLEELGDPAWTPLECAAMTIRTQPREVIENVADAAHFGPVHGMSIDEFEVTIDGHRATQRTVGKGRNLRGEPIDVETIATYHGPAIQYTRLGWAFDMVLINAHTPIDDDELILRFGVSLRAGAGVELPRELIEAHVAAARDGYFQDVRIWEHKRWRDRPLLADGDGPIGKIRRWHRSFFTVPAS